MKSWAALTPDMALSIYLYSIADFHYRVIFMGLIQGFALREIQKHQTSGSLGLVFADSYCLSKAATELKAH